MIDEIRKALKEKGMTQTELSALSPWTNKTVNNWLTGKYEAHEYKLKMLMDIIKKHRKKKK